MISRTRVIAVFAVIACSTFLATVASQAQVPLPIYVAPTPVVAAPRPLIYQVGCWGRVAPAQVTYTAYYAPQVPVVPLVPGPVPTVSAYYVPTVPVVQPYYASYIPVRRARRYVLPVAPAAYPVYWLPY